MRAEGGKELPLLLRALEALGGAALVLDGGLRVAGATPSAERLLAAPAPVGAPAARLLYGDDVERPIVEALAAGRAALGAVRRLRADGTERTVLVRARPLRPLDEPGGWLLLLEEASAPDDLPERFHTMWTRDVTVKRIFRLAEKVAHGDASVLIQGEMGTGKASLAAAIHALSPRHAGPFCPVSCAGATPALLEQHLTRHAREADGGTLFLDNVTELPLDVQAWLLRVLESGSVTPPEEDRPLPIDVRVIAATPASLQREVERGRFRADLMYRLRIVSLHLPPLRARRGDVPLLAEKLVAELSARGGRRVEQIAIAAFARMEQHAWPGNVRELRAAIESAIATGDGPVLLAGDLPPEIGGPAGPIEIDPAPSRSAASEEPGETTRVRRALSRAGGDRARAATMLGMSRTTLWRKMRSLGLLEPAEPRAMDENLQGKEEGETS